MTTASEATDPLSSWHDGVPKRAIVDFVDRVTREDSADFVPAQDRIAVFDNDGTLWCEAPFPAQVAFAIDELKRRSPDEMTWADDPMVKAALAGDVATLLAGTHHDGLLRILSLTHAGMTTEEFNERVRSWVRSYKSPRFDTSIFGMTYQPMQELLRHLAGRGFTNFIVSGGGADFMRVWSEELYGIPPAQVIGTTGSVRFEIRGDKAVLVKTLDNLVIDDHEGKPAGIHQFIARRPIASFGNSDGDQQMLEYTTLGNPHASFAMIVHHTDGEREYAYDAKPPATGKLVSALDAAARNHWTVVSMKNDWKTIFSQAGK